MKQPVPHTSALQAVRDADELSGRRSGGLTVPEGPHAAKASPVVAAQWPSRYYRSSSSRSSSSSSSSSGNTSGTGPGGGVRRHPKRAQEAGQKKHTARPPRAVHGAVLMGMITSATSVSDLASRVAAHADAMCELHVSAVLSKLVKQREFSSPSGAVDASAAQLMGTLLQMLVEPAGLGQCSRVDAMNSRTLCSSLWAVAKGGCEAHPAFQRLLARICADGHAVLTPCVAQELSNLAWAVAKVTERSLDLAMGGEAVSSLFAAIARAWMGGAGSLGKPQEVVNLLWAFAKVGCLVPVVAQPLWEQVGRMDPAAFKPQELSNLLWALATGGAWDVTVAQHLCAQVACMDLAAFKPQELSNLLWALATGGAGDCALAQKLCAHLGRTSLATFKPQELSNVLWALAKGGAWDPALAQHLCAHVARTDLGAFTPQQLSNVLWALATGGHVDRPLMEAVCFEASRRHARGWNAQNLANTVWALAAVADRNPPATRQQVAVQGQLLDIVAEAALQGSMATATPQSWSNLLWGFATLRHSSPALFTAAVDLLQPHTAHFTTQERANLLLAFGVAAPPSSLSALVAAWEGHLQLGACNEQELCNIGWALVVAGRVGGVTTGWEGLARVLLGEAGRRGLSRFTLPDLCQLHQLCCEVAFEGAEAGTLLPLPMWEAACEARGTNVSSSSASTVSRDVFRQLQRMGYSVRLEQRSPCGLLCVDMEVRLPQPALLAGPPGTAAGGWQRVALEVDGPTHFMTNDIALPDGATRLRDRHLSHSYGRPVVSINVRLDWEDKTHQQREQMLRRLLGAHNSTRRLHAQGAVAWQALGSSSDSGGSCTSSRGSSSGRSAHIAPTGSNALAAQSAEPTAP